MAVPVLRVGVVGAGAMGSLFGGYLAAAGHEVWLVDKWAEHVSAITEHGLLIMEPSGEERIVRVRATTEVGEVGQCDLVLVFVKSYHTAAVASELTPIVGSGTVVLTLQNGLGNVEALAEGVPRNQILAGTTGQGANVLGPGRVHHAGVGETVIGELDGRVTERLRLVSQVFNEAGLPASTSTNIEGIMWGKLLVNIAINPLTAILRVRNGQLLDVPAAMEVMKEAVSEGLEVARRAGVHIPYSDPWLRVLEVARLTAANRSSMMQDVEAGRRTEIDFINGAVVREGVRLGVITPVNLTLTRLVHCLETTGTRIFNQP